MSRRIPPLLYDALLLGLTVRECTRGRWRRAALPALLLRDGVWAFALVCCECAPHRPRRAASLTRAQARTSCRRCSSSC
jgi:hypothetical protein